MVGQKNITRNFFQFFFGNELQLFIRSKECHFGMSIGGEKKKKKTPIIQNVECPLHEEYYPIFAETNLRTSKNRT